MTHHCTDMKIPFLGREVMASKAVALEALQKEVQMRAAGSVPLADPQLHELR